MAITFKVQQVHPRRRLPRRAKQDLPETSKENDAQDDTIESSKFSSTQFEKGVNIIQKGMQIFLRKRQY
jgi:hypothetical protein